MDSLNEGYFQSLTGIQILVVEDNTADFDLVKEALLLYPIFNPVPAERISEAEALLARQKFDVVLLDLSLPDSFGLEGLRHLRKIAPELPFIVLTGAVGNRIAVEAMQEGAQDYLLKSEISGQTLLRSIRYAVERQHLGRRSLEDRTARAAAQEAARIRDEFISVASHELKTPLTSLKIQMQLRVRYLEKGNMNPFTAEKLSKMFDADLQQFARLSRLIDDMLDITRIAAGSLAIHQEKFDFSHLIQEVLGRFGSQLTDAGCEVSYNFDGITNCSGDVYRIEQVLTNLITNVLRYAKGTPVDISLSSGDEFCELRIQDHGAGIAKEDHERIFQRFERAGLKSEVSGLGLGLHIVKEIVGLHNGSVHVESELGKGSTFVVRLPIWVEDDAPLAAAALLISAAALIKAPPEAVGLLK